MPVEVLPWIEYRWSFDFPVAMFAAIRERLRGTPARIEELLRGVAPAAAQKRPAAEKWSPQEHAGHLTVVERLWRVRLTEYLRGSSELTAADMANRATKGEDFNARELDGILTSFRASRLELLASLDVLTLADAARTAHHPRLDVPMRLVDLCLFAAEHDDHHLAAIHVLVRA